MRLLSLRTRLRIGIIIAATVVLALSSTMVYALIRDALFGEFDNALGTQARLLTALAERRDNRLAVMYDAFQFPEFMRDIDPDYFCYWRSDGRLLQASPSLISSKGRLPRLDGTIAKPAIMPITLPDGRPGRAAGVTFRPKSAHIYDDTEGMDDTSPANPVTVTVARATTELHRDLHRLGWLLAGVCGMTVLAMALVMEFLLRLLLVPLDRFAGRIAKMDVGRMSGRLGRDGVPAELIPVAQRLDDLLDRLEAAFLRERAFSSDLAHELRTPLAGLRTTIEVTRAKDRPPEDYRVALDDCLAICMQTQGMVDSLLTLARADGGMIAPERTVVDLDVLLAECWTAYAAEATRRQLSIIWEVPALRVLVDRGLFRMVCNNLFANATAYTDTGGTVEVRAIPDHDHVALTVANTGCRLDSRQAQRVFERFWRGDHARSTTGLHCGLGLCLCRSIVTLHGGTITAKVDGDYFSISIILLRA
jgi:signal transduction histidine kinase